MDQQAMNLLLELTIDLVKHFEADQLIAYFELVAVLQKSLIDSLAVQDGPVGGVEIGQTILGFASALSLLGSNPSVQARSARIVDAYVSVKGTTHGHFGSVQRNRNRQQFSPQENKSRPPLTGPPILARVSFNFSRLFDHRNVFRLVRHLLFYSPLPRLIENRCRHLDLHPSCVSYRGLNADGNNSTVESHLR